MKQQKRNMSRFSINIKLKTIIYLKAFLLTIFLAGCSEDNGIGTFSELEDLILNVENRTDKEVEMQFKLQGDLSNSQVAAILFELEDADILLRVDFDPDTSVFQSIVFEGLNPNTEYSYLIRFEHTNGQLLNSSYTGFIVTYPTIPLPEIIGVKSEKVWAGDFAVFTGDNLSEISSAYGDYIENMMLGDYEVNGRLGGVYISDNIPIGLYPVSMKYRYHEIKTDDIVNVVRQSISSVNKHFDLDRIYSGSLTVYGSDFHPEIDKNEVYLNENRIYVSKAYSDSLIVSLSYYNRGNPIDLEPGDYSSLNLTIGSYKVETPFVVSIAPRPWQDREDMPISNHEGSLFEVNSKAYLVGGMDNDGELSEKLWEYDPSDDSWVEKTSFPGGERTSGVAITLNGKGYFGLGQSDSLTYHMDWWEYDPATDNWSQMKDFEGGGLLYGVGFSIDNIGYVGTGVSEGNIRKENFWKYNAGTDAWIRIADYPAGEERASAVVLNGKAYVGFGNNGSLQPNNKLYEYDPQSNVWEFFTEDPYESRSDGVLYTLNNKIYFLGGFDSNVNSSNVLSEYEINTNSWRRRYGHYLQSGSGMSYNGLLITIGGRTKSHVSEYNPDNDLY